MKNRTAAFTAATAALALMLSACGESQREDPSGDEGDAGSATDGGASTGDASTKGVAVTIGSVLTDSEATAQPDNKPSAKRMPTIGPDEKCFFELCTELTFN